jgi:endonuclease YncB( thermonuclease family)
MAGGVRSIIRSSVGLILCLCANGTTLAENPVPPEKNLTIDGTVMRIIDGDTVEVETKVRYRVRLIDCWAPESRTSDANEKRRGLQSKSRMIELAEKKSVRVTIPLTGNFTDATTMSRVLGRVWVIENDQLTHEDLSTIMVREGFATKVKVIKP